jgi:Domain of unknown function (DUF4411)
MKYLLDSDSLITAKNGSYSFESHQRGFWEWLEQANVLGVVGSLATVRKELTSEDQLSNWVQHQGSRFFVALDSLTRDRMTEIANWIQANEQFTDAAKQQFFAGADLSLIAYAAAHGCKVVTFEKDRPDAISKIQIPTVCKQFGVECINLYQLIGELKPKFVLAKPS